MESSFFDKFLKLIKPFQALRNSVRVTCVAVGAPGERRNVTTRIILREEELPEGQPYRQVMWLEPIPPVLIAVVDFPKGATHDFLCRAIEEYKVDLEIPSTENCALIRWPLPGTQPPRQSDFSWFDPTGPFAGDQFGENRACLTLTGTGGYIRDVMSDELWREVSSKLRLDPPHFDGIEGLYAKLLSGLRYGASDPRVVQVVFPLPLDMEQTEDGKLILHAPKHVADGQTQIVVNFGPSDRPTTFQTTHDAAKLTAAERTAEWGWEIPWPQGTESGKATLYYAREAVSSINLRRWPAAGTLRAAVDCHFDPGHERLRNDLLGENKKNSNDGKVQEAFEMAVVRLMNLHGIPLVWYGKGFLPRRNDAAGLVDRKEKRVVVLAECTVEKPEAKFSTLRDRAQKLAESLRGEAQVLPVVFTQVDPPESVFQDAYAHGIALVGRNQLNSLFDMLSSTRKGEDALSLLTKMRSLIAGIWTSLGGM